MRVRRDNATASARELLDRFLLAEDSPFRLLDGYQVPWDEFREYFLAWSPHRFTPKQIKASLPWPVVVGHGSGNRLYVGNVTRGHATAKRYDMDANNYLRL